MAHEANISKYQSPELGISKLSACRLWGADRQTIFSMRVAQLVTKGALPTSHES